MRYVQPLRVRLVVGIVALAVVGLAEGLIRLDDHARPSTVS